MEVVSIDSYGDGKNDIETLDAPENVDRALPETRCIAGKIEDVNEIVTGPFLGNTIKGGIGSKDNNSSLQSPVKAKSTVNISESLASTAMKVIDSRPYSEYLNDSEIGMSSMPMPYPNNGISSSNSLSQVQVSDMIEPPSLLVQVSILNENSPSTRNAPSQSCYYPIVDEHQKELSTLKDKLPGT